MTNRILTNAGTRGKTLRDGPSRQAFSRGVRSIGRRIPKEYGPITIELSRLTDVMAVWMDALATAVKR
jgi:hypothetical protein